jgi:uncharacterized protein YcfL
MGFEPHRNQTRKTTFKVFMPVLLSSLLLAGCASTPTAWEYKSLQMFVHSTPDLDQELNKLAEDGWSVITSSTSQGEGSSPYAVVLLKRPKQ